LPSTQAYFDDASKLSLAPIIVQPDPPRRSRPTLWIGGLLVLAAIFLWTRGNRLDASRSPRRSPRRAIDDDAADPMAAAHPEAEGDADGGEGDPPEYNAAPSSGAPASPATSDPTEEPR
jgi:hypothetical protein